MRKERWIPAFAGMTVESVVYRMSASVHDTDSIHVGESSAHVMFSATNIRPTFTPVIPAKAGIHLSCRTKTLNDLDPGLSPGGRDFLSVRSGGTPGAGDAGGVSGVGRRFEAREEDVVFQVDVVLQLGDEMAEAPIEGDPGAAGQ